MSKIQEKLCDLIQADGYGLVEAITEANKIITELKQEKKGTVYHLVNKCGDRVNLTRN